MKAVVVVEKGKAKVGEVPIPPVSPTEILVKVKAAALNPTDWKHLHYISPPGTILGCDYAGVVDKVGAQVTSVKVGDHVAGLVHGGQDGNKGAFAEYTPADPNLTFKVPKNLKMEEAAVFGVSGGTAGIALYQHLGLNTPDDPYVSNNPKLLVWGASSYSGIFAVQLAKLSGIRVVATASKHSHQLLRSLGAEVVFDYTDPKVEEKIKEWSENDLVYGLDCVSIPSSSAKASHSMSGGKLVVLLGDSLQNPDNNPNVKLQLMVLYTAMGKKFEMNGRVFEASSVDYENAQKVWALVGRLVENNLLRVFNLVNLGGLDGFEKGFKDMQEGKVRASKLFMSLD